TSLLPPNLLKLFAPRPLPPFLRPLSKDERIRGPDKLTGVGNLLQRIKEEAEDAELQQGLAERPETKSEANGNVVAQEAEAAEQKMDVDGDSPQDDPNATGDPYKTLFISRLAKEDLRREFEIYGAIERIVITRDRKGKSKSYAFIVFERERDMKAAYKDAEGIPIHHKRILVDVERGRTVKGWRPRKLGGGLGG
ncbi:hypothetical protein BCR39DRAFT_448211, partial [Naematelia encephala]